MYFNALSVLNASMGLAITDAQQRSSPTSISNLKIVPLRAFYLCRPEAGMLSGITWKRSMRSAFY
tara:strand:- start:313 stop:507 length:195 start_codon:yes stop_codon:yes gene_type:complete